MQAALAKSIPNYSADKLYYDHYKSVSGQDGITCGRHMRCEPRDGVHEITLQEAFVSEKLIESCSSCIKEDDLWNSLCSVIISSNTNRNQHSKTSREEQVS
jgi:hypothetical protein